MLDGEVKVTDYYLSNLGGVEYYRINDFGAVCSDVFDDASERNIDCIRDYARDIIESNSPRIDEVVARLLG